MLKSQPYLKKITKNEKIDVLLEQVKSFIKSGTDADYIAAYKTLESLIMLNPDEKAIKGYWGIVNGEIARKGIQISGVEALTSDKIRSRL